MIYISLIIFGILIGFFIPKNQEIQPDLFATYSGGKLKSQELIESSGIGIIDAEKSVYFSKKNLADQWFKKQIIGTSEDRFNLQDIEVTTVEFEDYVKSFDKDLKLISKTEYQNFLDNLKIKKAREMQNQIMLRKSSELQLRYHFPLPSYPMAQIQSRGKAVLGSQSAKISIPLFFNYSLPQLKNIFENVKVLNELFPNLLNFELRFLGQDSEDQLAYQIFQSLLCANQQKKLSDFHLNLLQINFNQKIDLAAIAKESKLDQQEFNNCILAQLFKSSILQDQAESLRLKILEPVLVINNRIIPATEDILIIKDLIQRGLDYD